MPESARDRAEDPARRIERHAAPAAAILALALSFAGIFQHGLWAPDEPREAEIGREMYVSRGSSLATLGGRPFLEEPPLFFWTMAAGFALFGVGDAVARLPAVLFSLVSLFAAYRMGRRSGGPLVAVLSVAVLATSSEFWWVSHRAVNDTALTAFVAAGHLLFLEARERIHAGLLRWPWFAGIGLLGALAFLTKGVIGLVLLGAPPLLAFLALGEWSAFRAAMGHTLGAGALFLAALGLPWMAALAGHPGGWGNVYECVVHQVVARGLGGSASFSVHAQPPWYYAYTFPLAAVPWGLALPAAVWSVARSPRSESRVRFLGWLVLAGVVLLSIPAGKRELYVMPLLPAASVVFATWSGRADGARLVDRITGVALLALVGLGTTAALVAAAAARLFEVHGPALIACGAAAAAALALSSARAAWSVGRGRTRVLGGTVVLHVVLFAALAHLIGRPLVDPLRGLKRGALEVAGQVPPSEPLVALEPDETTLAVVPFYTGRLVEPVLQAEVGDLLRRGHTRYLLVMDTAEQHLADALRRQLDVVARVRMSNTRGVTVYRWVGSVSPSGPPWQETLDAG